MAFKKPPPIFSRDSRGISPTHYIIGTAEFPVRRDSYTNSGTIAPVEFLYVASTVSAWGSTIKVAWLPTKEKKRSDTGRTNPRKRIMTVIIIYRRNVIGNANDSYFSYHGVR